MVSEDVVEEVAVDAGEEAVQLLLLQQRGAVTQVQVGTTVPRLGEPRSGGSGGR